MKIYKAHRLRLYPSLAQRQAMARHAVACRWLWNYMLALQEDTYERDRKFVFSHDMSKMLPGLKKENPWLSDAPSNSLVQVCAYLDRALKDSFRNGKGFPKFKARGKSKDSFYVINQALAVGACRAKLPKLGTVRFRSGRLPEGRIVSGNVSRTADYWWLTVQCEVEVPERKVEPKRLTVVGVDLGLKDLMIRSARNRSTCAPTEGPSEGIAVSLLP